jgi:hypothetical protein
MSRRYCFTVTDEEGARFDTFAAMRAAPVNSLAIVAIREYIDRKEADRKRTEGRRKAISIDEMGDNGSGRAAASPEGISKEG